MKSIYLDNNGSTHLDPRVRDHLIQVLQEVEGNPSSSHSFGRKAKMQLTQSRDLIAGYLGIKPQELIFTSGGTESANMIIKGIANEKEKGHIITSTIEHSCVLMAVKAMEKNGWSVNYLSPGEEGYITPEAVSKAITKETRLIAIMAVNNETGVKSDIAAIAKIAEQHKIHFFVDGVALLGKEPFTIPSGVSAMSFSGHKLHAPKGIGLAFIRSNFKLIPLLTGGEQEFGKRGGTENIFGILGLAMGVKLLSTELQEASFRMELLRNLFEKRLFEGLNNVLINGSGPRVVNTSNLSFTGVDGESLLIALDASGIAASHGSACASGSSEPSRVLLAMGLPLERVRSSIRFSLSRFTTETEIESAAATLIKIISKMRKTA